jgi:hypothetical protein
MADYETMRKDKLARKNKITNPGLIVDPPKGNGNDGLIVDPVIKSSAVPTTVTPVAKRNLIVSTPMTRKSAGIAKQRTVNPFYNTY